MRAWFGLGETRSHAAHGGLEARESKNDADAGLLSPAIDAQGCEVRSDLPGMRLERSMLAVTSLSLSMLSAALPGPAAATLHPATTAETRGGSVVISGHGEARAVPNAPWQPLVEGAPVPRRGELRSGDATLRMALAHGAVVELAPGTVVAVFDHLEIALLGLGKLDAARLEIRSGEVTITAPISGSPRDRSPVLVQSDGGLFALAIEGSLVARSIGIGRDAPLGGLSLATYAGQAQFASHGAFHPLARGEAIDLRASQPAPAPHAIGVGPGWYVEEGAEATGPLAVVTDRDATTALTLRFANVAATGGNDLEIAGDEAFSTVLARGHAPAKSTVITTPPLAPGRYFARMRARGVEGLPSLVGPTRPLRIALAALPPGGSVEGSTFTIPAGRALAWDDPTGLEISVGSVGFIHASRELRPVHDAATVARVRLLGDRSFIPLSLVPSAVSAAIEIGPKWATWPTIPVEIEVRLVSSRALSAAVDTARFEPKLRVTVNLVEVPVTWKRESNLLRAKLSRPAGMGGPWVVRVEAMDQDSNPIGRGFLEVVEQK
ncbi:MAG: hypothetical protein ABJE95_14840 [Byssovorax sp.]